MIIRQPLFGRELWLWPDAEAHIIRNFSHGPTDVEAALAIIEPVLKARRVCVQAGGCMGVWPRRLAEMFETVWTFEAEPCNFRCLRHNVADLGNVNPVHGALSSELGAAGVARDATQAANCGAYYLVAGDRVPAVTIDSLDLETCDLIYLDVEGHERKALEGARETVERFWPVIGIESNGLHRRYGGRAERWLEDRGYAPIGSHARDTIWSR